MNNCNPIAHGDLGNSARTGTLEEQQTLHALVPAATPEPIRAVLEREVQEALKSPDLQVRMRAQELEPLGTTGGDAAVKLKSTAAQWRNVVKAANIPAE